MRRDTAGAAVSKVILALALAVVLPAAVFAGETEKDSCASLEEYEAAPHEGPRYRSASNVVLFSMKDLFPPNLFFATGGMDYGVSGTARDRISNLPVYASAAGDALVLSGLVVPFAMNETRSNMPLVISGLSLWGAAFLSDSMYYGQTAGLLGASDYIESVRDRELGVPAARIGYKDPFMAASASLLVPGGGFFYQGRMTKGYIWLGVEVGAALAAGIYAASSGGPNMSSFWVAVATRYLFVIPEMCTAMMDTDSVNELHIRQLLAKGSPYRIKEDPSDTRNPLAAFIIAAFTVPGLGNMYAGNQEGGNGLLTLAVVGGSLALLSGVMADNWNSPELKSSMVNIGAVIMCVAKYADMATAPASAEIYNYIHAGKKYAGVPDITTSPAVIGNAPGIIVALNY